MELEQPVLRRRLTSAPPERKCVYGIERGMIFWGEVIPTEARGSEQNHDDPSP